MRTVFPDRLEDRPKAEFFARSPAGFFVEWEQTSRDRARRPGISNRPAGLESWSNRGPNLPSGCEPSRRARVVAAACSSPVNAGAKMTLFLFEPPIRRLSDEWAAATHHGLGGRREPAGGGHAA
jgi:hypothetical protein